VQSVLEIAQHLQNCRGKRIVFQPLERVVAEVNGEDIKSVILNLVVNALDSMDEGGTLTITLQLHDGRAELLFVDSGCGMSGEILQNIFEPFYTKSRSGKGTGLGLFISHQIIDQHSGEISAASAGPNQGSTFTVRLPLKPTSTEARGPEGVLPFPGNQRNAATANSPTENGLGHAAA
jgi:signal transduction histidine kinase